MKSNEKYLLVMLIVLIVSLFYYNCAPYSSDGWDSGDGGDGWGDGEIPPGQITAGEWSDLDNWSFWENLMLGQNPENDWSDMISYWGINTLDRYPVVVKYNIHPVNNVTVQLSQSGNILWETKTDNSGQAELFSSVFQQPNKQTDLDIVVTDGTNTMTVDVDTSATWENPQVIDIDGTFPNKPTPAYTLDLMFMIDTTGSMGDELNYIKAELQDVIQRVNNDNSGLTIRISCNFYRDEGDDYVVRSFPFSDNISTVLDNLNQQNSAGGGDYEEAVDQALMNAIDLQVHSWSNDAYSRLLFLVLDAPPHHEANIIDDIHYAVQKSAELGIKIIPVAASGADKNTEFLLRFIDILTGGTYVFITNDSGIGGDHIEPTVGEYEVEFLNDLIIRLINENVENL